MSELRIGLALGGGSARGLAHITVLEAFDDVGIKPHAMTGTSAGALIASAYASGMTAWEIREHACALLAGRLEAARHILRKQSGRLLDLIDLKGFGSVQIDGAELVRLALPDAVAERIEDTAIPLRIVTTDFYRQAEITLDSGLDADIRMAPSVATTELMPSSIGGDLALVADGLIRDEGASDVAGRATFATDPVLGTSSSLSVSAVPATKVGVLVLGAPAAFPIRAAIGCGSYVDLRFIVTIPFVTVASGWSGSVPIPDDAALEPRGSRSPATRTSSAGAGTPRGRAPGSRRR